MNSSRELVIIFDTNAIWHGLRPLCSSLSELLHKCRRLEAVEAFLPRVVFQERYYQCLREAKAHEKDRDRAIRSLSQLAGSDWRVETIETEGLSLPRSLGYRVLSRLKEVMAECRLKVFR